MDKEEYRRILECLQGKVDDKKLWKQADTFEVKNGKLYKKKKNGKILRVLQEDETETVLYMVHNHEMGGHFGIDATYNKIAERYGSFAIEKGETAKKNFFELIVILDIFQPKNHICHININFIFLAVSPFSIAKGPYVYYKKYFELNCIIVFSFLCYLLYFMKSTSLSLLNRLNNYILFYYVSFYIYSITCL